MRRNKIIILILMLAIAVMMSCQMIPSSVPVKNTNIDNKSNSSNSYKIAEGGSDTDNPGPVPTKAPLPSPSLLERIPEILTGTISLPNTNITMGKGLPSISKANRFGRVELTYGTMPDGQEGITGGRLIFNYNHYETINDEQFASKSVSMDLNLRIPLVRDYDSKDIIKLKSDSIDNYPGFYDTYPDFYKREFATRLQVYSSGGCTRVTKDSYFNQSVSAELSILVNGRAEGTISSISAGSSTGTFSNGSGGSGACSPYLELPTPGLSGNVTFDLNIAEFAPQLEIVVKNPTGENAAAIISPINQDKKYDKAEFRVKAFPEERWRLIVEGEINGQVRQWRQPGDGTRDQPITDEQAGSIQSGDGKRGKAIPWYGKTNDAVNSKDDSYFEDGNYIVKLIRTNGYTEFETYSPIMVDNTPPEVFVDDVSINGDSASITGRVIDHIPGDVGTPGAGLNPDSFPNSFSRQMSVSPNEDITQALSFSQKPSKNASNFSGNIANLEDSIPEEIEYSIADALENILEDEVGNQSRQAISISTGEIREEGDMHISNFNVKATPDFSKVVRITEKENKFKVKNGDNCAEVALHAAKSWREVKYNFVAFPIGNKHPLTLDFHFGLCPGEGFVKSFFSTQGGILPEIEKVRLKGKIIIKKFEKGAKYIYLEPVDEDVEFDNGFATVSRIWKGSVRNQNQFQFDSSKRHTLVGPPFATNGTYLGLAVLKVFKDGKQLDTLTDAFNFDVENKHPGYNNKFDKEWTSIYPFAPNGGIRSPYKLSDERKYHIRSRHDINFMNPYQFLSTYKLMKGLFTDVNFTRSSVEDIFSFRNDEGKEKEKKGLCFPENVTENSNLENLFRNIESIANMEDIDDYWGSSTSKALEIKGKRDSQFITIWINKEKNNYSFGEVGKGAAFPDTPILGETAVKAKFQNLASNRNNEIELANEFNLSWNWVYSKTSIQVYEDVFFKQLVGKGTNSIVPKLYNGRLLDNNQMPQLMGSKNLVSNAPFVEYNGAIKYPVLSDSRVKFLKFVP